MSLQLPAILSPPTPCIPSPALTALRASLSCLGSFSEVTADKVSSLILFPSLSIFLRPLPPAIVTRLRSVRLVLAASRLACATTDALTPAWVRFFGRSSRHELRSLARRQVSHVCRLPLPTPIPPPTTRQAPAETLSRVRWVLLVPL